MDPAAENREVVRRFEDEFKNRENHDIVDDVMSDDFVHHAPFPGLPPGKDGMRAVGQFVVGAIADISVEVTHLIGQGDLVADRISASGVRRDTDEAVTWTENHFYRLSGGRIVEWWPEGGPPVE